MNNTIYKLDFKLQKKNYLLPEILITQKKRKMKNIFQSEQKKKAEKTYDFRKWTLKAETKTEIKTVL